MSCVAYLVLLFRIIMGMVLYCFITSKFMSFFTQGLEREILDMPEYIVT